MSLDRFFIIPARVILFMVGMAAVALPVWAQQPAAIPGTFAENPIVYFVMTDRFVNGDPYQRPRLRPPAGDEPQG